MKKIYVKLRENLNEHDWNYHVSASGGKDDSVHGSENKYRMIGRDTGHFGSGTYFSTYKYVNPSIDDEYGDNYSDDTPSYINVGGKIYRADFDLYKNLYKVRSKKEGDLLYTMMKNLNNMYYRINQDYGKFNKKYAMYANASLYQIISRNANALGLKCPSYLTLTRMAQDLGKDDARKESFSTAFMEWNGYNGVNVSGIEYYDNTLHGSVIYDMSKVDNMVKQASEKDIKLISTNGSYNNTISSTNGFLDPISYSLSGQKPMFIENIASLDKKTMFRVMRNYLDNGYVFDVYSLKKIPTDVASKYLMYVYKTNQKDKNGNSLKDELCDERYFYDIVDRCKAYYWINYCDGLLVSLLSNFSLYLDFNLSDEERYKSLEQYLNYVSRFIRRDLTEDEKDYIDNSYFPN